MIQEEVMRKAFESLAKTKELMKEAEKLYIERDEVLNSVNVSTAVEYLSEVYDYMSEIWENDLN